MTHFDDNYLSNLLLWSINPVSFTETFTACGHDCCHCFKVKRDSWGLDMTILKLLRKLACP